MATISICWKSRFEKFSYVERIYEIFLLRIDKHFIQCYLYRSVLGSIDQFSTSIMKTL